MAESAAADAAKDRPRRRLYTQLWFLVLVAIVAGIAFGLAFPEPAKDAKWLADAFIQLIQTITGPVIFVTVVIGIASLGNVARAGGLAFARRVKAVWGAGVSAATGDRGVCGDRVRARWP